MSLTSFSVCLFLVYRKATDFCVLILHPATLMNMFSSCRGVLVECFMCRTISPVNKDTLTCSFFICTLCISLYCSYCSN